MSNKGMFFHGNRMQQLIKEKRKIHKFEIINCLGMSLSTYEKIKPWFEYTFGESIRYCKQTKEWEYIENENNL